MRIAGQFFSKTIDCHKFRRYKLFRNEALSIALALIPLFFSFSPTRLVAKEKFRVIIMTDMTHDDGNSLIRYLYYSNEFDTEAIIVTPQLPDFNFDAKEPLAKAHNIIGAYSKEYDQLKKHHQDYPSPASLLETIKKGSGALPIIWLTNTKEFKGHIADRYVESRWGDIKYSDWIGEGKNPNGEPKDSEGSEFLQKIFEKEDDRPIYVQMWGGPVTFVQALYRYGQKHGNSALENLMKKLHVFGIHLQDISFDFMINLDHVQKLNCLNMGDVQSTYDGKRYHPRWFLFDHGHFWHYVGSSEPGYKKPMTQADVQGHGPMSELYDNGGEGDSPSFLYLLSANRGLNDPLEPAQGSWGSLFKPMGDPFPDGYYSTCGTDKSHLIRWAEDARHNFENRLDYSLKNPDKVNHEPVPIVNGLNNKDIHVQEATPGKVVELDASGSKDPDNDQITYNWYFYPEASTVKDIPSIENSTAKKIQFRIPESATSGTLHLILEIKDSGSPALKSYERIIFKIHTT